LEEYVECIVEEGGEFENPKNRDHFGDVGADERSIPSLTLIENICPRKMANDGVLCTH
jgi:hypothetical protein